MRPNHIDEFVHPDLQVLLHLSPPYVVPYVLAEIPGQVNLINTLGYVIYVLQPHLLIVVHGFHQDCHLSEDLPVK